MGANPPPEVPVCEVDGDIISLPSLGVSQEFERGFIEETADRIFKEDEVKFASFKADMRTRIKEVHDTLFSHLHHNAEVPQLEVMDRNEFVVDKRTHQKLIAEGNAVADQVRAEILKSNLSKQLIRDRIVEATHDTMEGGVPSDARSGGVQVSEGEYRSNVGLQMELHGFKSGLVVKNLVIRKIDAAQQLKLDKIKVLRMTELTERKIRRTEEEEKELPTTFLNWNDWFKDPTVPYKFLKPEMLSQIFGSGGAEGSEDGAEGGVAAGADGAADNAPAEGAQEDEDTDQTPEEVPSDLLSLLYHPFEAISRHRRITQQALLEAVVHELKQWYNNKFEEYVREKEKAMESIDEKNSRIKEIINDELGADSLSEEERSIFHHELCDGELPLNVLSVKPAEIKAEKFLSEAERERLRKEAEEAERRRLEALKDNMFERALKQMMGGSLESKKEGGLDSLFRPEWMDTTPPKNSQMRKRQKSLSGIANTRSSRKSKRHSGGTSSVNLKSRKQRLRSWSQSSTAVCTICFSFS